jgi:hypothetical protein
MGKPKVLVIGAVLLALVLILGSIGLACGTKSSTTTEPGMPANYTTYTDKSGLFSISYPADWETPLSQTPMGQNANESTNKPKSGLPVKEETLVFFSGKRAITYDPYVNIALEPVPAAISTNDQMIGSEVQSLRKACSDYHELSRVKTTIDGKEATILEWEGTAPGGQGLSYCQQLYILTDKAIWVVTCGSTPEESAQWKNDFDTILRSLRISD